MWLWSLVRMSALSALLHCLRHGSVKGGQKNAKAAVTGRMAELPAHLSAGHVQPNTSRSNCPPDRPVDTPLFRPPQPLFLRLLATAFFGTVPYDRLPMLTISRFHWIPSQQIIPTSYALRLSPLLLYFSTLVLFPFYLFFFFVLVNIPPKRPPYLFRQHHRLPRHCRQQTSSSTSLLSFFWSNALSCSRLYHQSRPAPSTPTLVQF